MTEPPTLRRLVVCIRSSNVISEYNTGIDGREANGQSLSESSWWRWISRGLRSWPARQGGSCERLSVIAPNAELPPRPSTPPQPARRAFRLPSAPILADLVGNRRSHIRHMAEAMQGSVCVTRHEWTTGLRAFEFLPALGKVSRPPAPIVPDGGVHSRIQESLNDVGRVRPLRHHMECCPTARVSYVNRCRPMSRRYPALIASTTRDCHGDHRTGDLEPVRGGCCCTQ